MGTHQIDFVKHGQSFMRWCLQGEALLLCLVSATAIAQPRFAVVGGFERTYGSVPRTANIYDTLTITNPGTGMLRIIGINPTCGCTAAVIDTNIIPAGKQAHVYVKIEPPDAMEKVHKTIVFLTNDLSAPSREVGFGFEIQRDIAIVPRHFAFAGCKIHEPCVCAVNLRNLTINPITTFRQPMTVPGLRSLMPDTLTIAAHDSVSYRLQLTPDTTGYQSGRFVLLTTSAIDPKLEFTIAANAADKNGIPVIKSH